MPRQFGAGPSITLDDLPPEARTIEATSSPMWPQIYGVEIMNAMRRKPMSLPGIEGDHYRIGGHVQLTTVMAGQPVMSATLHVYSDQIGKPLAPAGELIAPHSSTS